jgi:hypothetical protein
MEPFLPGIAKDFDDYLQVMSQPGVWGGECWRCMAGVWLGGWVGGRSQRCQCGDGGARHTCE